MSNNFRLIGNRVEDPMGDKSPKSKERNKKQKSAAEKERTDKAKAKQDGQVREIPVKK